MKRLWSHDSNKQTTEHKSVTFKSERRADDNLQFISLTLWQHHGDGAVWATQVGSVRGRKKNVTPVQLLRSPRAGDELCWSKQHGRGWVVYSNDRQVSFVQTKTEIERKGMQESAPLPSWLTPGRSSEEPADQSPAESTLHLQRREKGKVSIRYAWLVTCWTCCTSFVKALSRMMGKTKQ